MFLNEKLFNESSNKEFKTSLLLNEEEFNEAMTNSQSIIHRQVEQEYDYLKEKYEDLNSSKYVTFSEAKKAGRKALNLTILISSCASMIPFVNFVGLPVLIVCLVIASVKSQSDEAEARTMAREMIKDLEKIQAKCKDKEEKQKIEKYIDRIENAMKMKEVIAYT